MRALGDSKRPLYYLIVCCFLNIVLDLFTVVVLNMGIAGAAIATVISQAVSAALVTRSLMKSYDLLKLRLRAIRIHPDLLRAEFRIGLPGGLQSCAYSISNIIIQAAINNFGTDTAAAWAAFGKWTPFSGPSADPSALLLPPLPVRTSEPAGLTASRKVSGYVLPWPWVFPVSCWSFLFCLLPAAVLRFHHGSVRHRHRRIYVKTYHAQLYYLHICRNLLWRSPGNRRRPDPHDHYHGRCASHPAFLDPLCHTNDRRIIHTFVQLSPCLGRNGAVFAPLLLPAEEKAAGITGIIKSNGERRPPFP